MASQPPPKSTKEVRADSDSTAHVDALRNEVEALRFELKRITANDAIGGALTSGFSEVIEKLEPLRDLRPRPNGEPIKTKTAKALIRLREALRSPDWSNVDALPIKRDPVPWIGQPNDADGDDPFDPDDFAFAPYRKAVRR
jgi:hypothetical protein